jgi:hypothetical protein
MRAPSIKRLMLVRGMTPKTAATLRFYIHGGPLPARLSRPGWDYLPRPDRIMALADLLINGYGVECLWEHNLGLSEPRLDYINLGDPYDITLLYDHVTQTYRVGSWGDVAARLGANAL